ncbi:hydrolase [Capsulimonas corticalis]|uniref:Hydrolase n=1 Tax=Capsulimonas corticalis TaxID=2219043 RepID=A0A402CSN7_9BACT|nr:alpha/beta hydrolase [Capsulimonas corticalis]BDI31023.1 hydrolase [Capsulimonas corticalis]
MANTALDFKHRYLAGAAGAPTLLLLHGTGGDENDLLGLGQTLLPGAGLLSPRGKVMEGASPRFFRRLAAGVFDLEDLRLRTDELAEFITSGAGQYGFDPARVIAVGYSNGANIAASLLLRHPGALSAAVLLHAMTPFVPETPPALDGTPVLITAGRVDPMVPAANVEQLARILNDSGADVSLRWSPGGHGLTEAEVDAATQWLAAL